MRDKTLFIGNGLNRTLESGLSWAQLMDEIGSDITEDAEVPFPLVLKKLLPKMAPLSADVRAMHIKN